MGSFVARIVFYLIFGLIISETIREFNKLFSLALNPYMAIIPAVLIYIFQELLIKEERTNDKAIPMNTPMEPKLHKVFYFMAWILVTSFFLGILFIWAGTVYKQIKGA
ncbi:MAG: hypothetical protein K9N21_10065 [Deltaproteobacteria bacterium]|nr:hypothetical protein [Deltaproteobacteria bacterium]